VKTSVPSLAARGGNLSEFLANPNDQIYDPKTGDSNTGVGRKAFANNVIPADRLSQQSLNILKLIPAPNAAGDAGKPFSNNFVSTGSEAFDSNQWDTRWDYYITTRRPRLAAIATHRLRKALLALSAY